MIVKNLQVEMTVGIGLGEIEMPKAVFEELKKWEEQIINDDHIMSGEISSETADWLARNLEKRDGFEWKYEIKAID